MKTYYITFGQKHPLRDGWIEIEGEDYEAARKKGFEIFGKHFAFIRETNDITSMLGYFPAGKFGKTLFADRDYDDDLEPPPKKEPDDFSGATPGDR